MPVRDTIELLCHQIELHCGSPEEASHLDLDPLWGWNFRGNVVHALAWLFATPRPENRWYMHPVLLDAIERAGERLFRELADEEHLEVFRRTGHPLIHGFALARGHLRTPDRWMAGIAKLMTSYFLPVLRERERLTIFSSANCGYGTNHLAVELSALSAFVHVFEGDPQMMGEVTGREDLVSYARKYLERFMAYMAPGGYWAECDGPANQYNKLTASALLRAAMDLKEVTTYRSHFERAARFHITYLFPNLWSVGVTDGRNRQGTCVDGMAFCGLLPEGRNLLRLVAQRLVNESRQGRRLSGEMLAELVTYIRAEPYFSHELAPLVWERESYTDSIGEDFAVLKRGPWMAAFSNFVFRPRPEGHWNLDYQNLLSLYHRAFGIIFYGHNSKKDPELSTFNKAFMTFDSRPLDKPMWKYVPGKGRFAIRDDGFDLMRDYRGFEGYLSLRFHSDSKATLTIRANTRLSEYPITCSLQPAAGYRRRFQDANGAYIEIDEKAFHMTGAQLGGVMVLEPESCPDVTAANSGRPLRLNLPPDAELVWPHKAWDPYNLESDRCEKPDQWTLLLKIPVWKDGVELALELL
ncbi:MAG: hypothetical protein N2255_09990 [Kiritimatiellae bacterium]|nr:hypothetical protein [Kiritimatiellia bacterium]